MQENIYEHMLLSFEHKNMSSGYIFCRFFPIFNVGKDETHFIHCPWAPACGLRQVLEHLPKIATLDGELLTGDDDEAPFWKTKIC